MENGKHVVDVMEGVVAHLVQIAHLPDKLLEFGFVYIHSGEPHDEDLIGQDSSHLRAVV